MKKIFIAVVVIGLIILGVYFFNKKSATETPVPADSTLNNETANTGAPGTTAPKTEAEIKKEEAIKSGAQVLVGKSVEGREIIGYNFGTGTKQVLFVGGIHGGYSWNTTELAYELVDYLAENPSSIPKGVKVTIIPALNPDGLAKVIGGKEGRFERGDISTYQTDLVSGRFNANNVDLNRNFNCEWQAKGTWQDKTVSGGESVFSEPESVAVKNYIEKTKPAGVVVFYSSAGGVYASRCGNTAVLPQTEKMVEVYAEASGYKAYQDFNSYNLTGDMVNWLAKSGVPAISVLLSNHSDTEWTRNKAGIEAILKNFGN